MRTATVHLTSISPYSQSRYYTDPPRGDKETSRDYEARTWMHRTHVDEKGHVFIPPMAFKNCIAEAAKFLSLQIPGRGKSTYTKHFEAGILVVDALVFDGADKRPLVTRQKVEGEWLFVPADGVRGSGKRVEKCFPLIRQWNGAVVFHVLDNTVTRDVFERHLKEAGSLIGIGRFRPRNNGFYGRFAATKLSWVDV
jgi:hypothetical protein